MKTDINTKILRLENLFVHLLVFNSLYPMCISLGNRQDSNVPKGQHINNFISTQLKIRTC